MKKFDLMPEIVKLGHIALVSADLEKSLWFFKEVIGLEETTEVDGVHYLRSWGDFEHHTLSIEAGPESRIDHVAWKARRREDVGNFAVLLEAAGVDVEKIEAGHEKGQGEAIRFYLPSGHNFEIYFDMEKPLAAPDRRSRLKNQPYKAWAKGVSPRRIDHVNLMTSQSTSIISDFLAEKLGFQMRDYIELPGGEGELFGAWMSVSPLPHDIAVMTDPRAKSPSEIHHIAFWLESGNDMLRAADILSEFGFKFRGPGKHGASQAMYIYVEDPGSGLRVELFAGGLLILDPDWEALQWTPEEMEFAITYWGQESATDDAMMTGLYAGAVKEEEKI